jgi:glycosyltransferase involved in cell wall biosynthesis
MEIMEKISATIITHNEQDNILRCLESIKWVDEIIIVDSQSNDNTITLCKEYTDKIYVNPWSGYVRQKNFAVEKASHNWILSLDADEELSPALKEEIITLKKSGFTFNGYKIPRKVFYLGHWIEYSGWYPNYKMRLFNREFGKWQGDSVHEYVALTGAPGKLKGDIYHYSYKSLSDHLERINTFTTLAAESMKKNGRKSSYVKLLYKPFFKFVKSYILKKGFLDGFTGLIIAVMGSFYVFLKYLKLWELQKTINNR